MFKHLNNLIAVINLVWEHISKDLQQHINSFGDLGILYALLVNWQKNWIKM